MTDSTQTRDETQVGYTLVDSAGRPAVSGRLPAWMLDDQRQHLPDGGAMLDSEISVLVQYADMSTSPPTIKDRPANPSTLAGMKISNVPNPSAVTIGTESPVDVQDGEVDLEFAYPGTYTITVSSWPYLDAIFTVTQQ